MSDWAEWSEQLTVGGKYSDSDQWRGRNLIVAALIPPGSTVLDIGAWGTDIRSLLAPGCTYTPADVVKRGEDFEVIDFEKHIYPTFDEPFDYVVLSGVLEHITDPVKALYWARQFGKKAVVTYAPYVDGTMDQRLNKHWKSHLKAPQIEEAFRHVGFMHRFERKWRRQYVWSLNRSQWEQPAQSS